MRQEGSESGIREVSWKVIAMTKAKSISRLDQGGGSGVERCENF